MNPDKIRHSVHHNFISLGSSVNGAASNKRNPTDDSRALNLTAFGRSSQERNFLA